MCIYIYIYIYTCIHRLPVGRFELDLDIPILKSKRQHLKTQLPLS